MADTSVVRTYLSARDHVIAALLGILFFVATCVWGVSGIDPSQWNEVAVASGIRPPQAIFPGVWRLLAGCLFSVLDMRSAMRVLSLVGAFSGACCVSLAYCIVRQTMTRLLRMDASNSVLAGFIVPFFAVVAALLFGVSEPLWDMSQTFSSDGLHFLLILLATHIWLRWFERGGGWRLFSVVALVGLLMAETPFAFVIPVFFLTWYVRLWRNIEDGALPVPKHLPTPYELPYWRMFFLFLGVLALVVWGNVTSFEARGGLASCGWSGTDIYFRYGAGYWHVFADASTLIGWALGLGLGVFPVVVALRLFSVVTRDDQPMPFHLGTIMFFVGCVAILSTGVFPAARFWTFAKDSVVVGSGALLTFYVFLAAFTFALAGASFAIECQRLYLADDERRPGVLFRLLSPAAAVVVVVASFVQVPRPVTREAQRVVEDAVSEIVRECGTAKWIFTDGRLDAGIELEAQALGKDLLPLNMMSGPSDWEKALRVRKFPPGADRDAVEIGVPMLLRIWATEKDAGMADVAIQLGFELWKRAQKPLPTLSGMVAREKGLSAEEAARGVEAARLLSERVVAVSERMGRVHVSPALVHSVSAVSWRLSRFARMRNDERLADRLDGTNGAIKKMLSIIEYERQRTFMQMTPREGLDIALKRADFAEAYRYASFVLRANPKSPEANFGTAMYFLKIGNLKDAEKHLRRVLEVRPDEPAVLNNLSIVCRKTKRYDEAVSLAKHALRMLPDSAEVKQTLADAEAKKP